MVLSVGLSLGELSSGAVYVKTEMRARVLGSFPGVSLPPSTLPISRFSQALQTLTV